MALIRFEMADWLYNAGLVGLVNILESSGDNVIKKNSYIEIEDEYLEGFEEKYFKYFFNKYEAFTSWYKLTSFIGYIDGFDAEKAEDKDIDNINIFIDDLKKKLTSNSYKSAYLLLESNEYNFLEDEKKLQKIKLVKKQSILDVKDKITEQLKLIKQILINLKSEEVKKVIMAKNVTYDIIQQFWSDVSFLNKNNSKNDMYEEYKNYFLKGAVSYASAEKKKYKYTCFTCGDKLAKLSKPDAYDLTWINKMGVDMSRKSSHFWNFNGDLFICPMCNLVYSCVPAGFTMLRGRGIFINENSSFKNLLSINQLALNNNVSFEDLEEQSYFNIIDSMAQGQVESLNKETENIQVIKLDSQNERRPYTFNLLSKEKLNIIYHNKNMLKTLVKVHIKISKDYYINLYREVIQRLYEGKNQFDLISELIYLNLQGKFNGLKYIETIIKINNDFIGGGKRDKMAYDNKFEDKRVYAFKKYGMDLKKAYEKGKTENKLSGISYRLLNALKTKDSARFMDTLINSYMYIKEPIPTYFVEGLKDIEVFQTIGYSFLIGLQGGEQKENKEETING